MVYETTLQHWGIKGQKWGVRRYQNKDGSLTSAGKKRYSGNSDSNSNSKSTSERKGMSSSTKKKLVAGATVGATAILAAYAISNPKARGIITSMASKSFDAVKTAAASEKTKAFLKKTGDKAVKTLNASASRVGNAMCDAALLSMGTIAISKLTTKLATDENASESLKNRNKVILDTTTAGINALTKANSSSNKNSSNNKGGSVGKEISDALGSPNKKSIDKSGNEWQSLFKDSNGNQRDSDTRATIKSLASAGYGIDQITEYLNKVDRGELKHSYAEVADELNYYAAMRYVDDILT